MNKQIKQCRDVAMELLKPSQKDLDHGLEIHKDAMIFDAYGFGAHAAVDGDALGTAIKAGASAPEIRDLIEEMIMTRCVHDVDEREEVIEAWQASGVTCVFENAGEEGNSVKILLKRLARHTYVTDNLKDIICKATTANDVKVAKQAGKHSYCFTINGVPLAEAGESTEAELGFIRIFRQLGVRMMHLTYNRRNLIGDGCAETSDAGLSDFGQMVIRELNRCEIIPDVAHCGLQTSLDAAKTSNRPVVASHTACRALNEHCRNKPDDVIKAIADTGGVIGICCIPAFLGGTGDIRAFLDHIDHLAKVVGSSHIAIGTDRPYISSRNQQEAAKATLPKHHRPIFENYWPPNDPLGKPEWNRPEQLNSLAWTNWPLFTVGLVQRGYSGDDIRKIIGGNVLRLLH